ncbi:CvpA family protein [Afifella pfennigii]|uniref:CvpA family protein n=1 Tax=Afifella pfennigii TaxID=209897 RepID=UPI00047CA796|nr:CvpA family protein [Afifella pfennigii]
MPITLLDGVLILVMFISAMLAMIRGFTREVFSIASWVIAAIVTYMFWQDVLPFTQGYVDDRTIAMVVTVAGIFFLTLIVVSLVTMRISDFILDSKAGPLDRTFGFLFGAARGLLLVVIAVLFLNFFISPDNQPEWIGEARSKPWLDAMGEDLMNVLPEDPEAEIIERFRQLDAERQGQPQSSGDAAGGYDADDQNALSRQLSQ